MVYITLLFLLLAAAFGISGMAGIAVAPVHVLFSFSMLALLASLAGSLFRRR
jgi:hypothetical protein